MTYEQLAEIFAKYDGMGKGKHHNVASTTRATNPRDLYMPNKPTTSESNGYSAWDKVCLFADAAPHLDRVDTLTDSITYRLKPDPEQPADVPEHIAHADEIAGNFKNPPAESK